MPSLSEGQLRPKDRLLRPRSPQNPKSVVYRRGTNSIRFVYTTNANGKIFGDFYVSFFDIFFISWSKGGMVFMFDF